MSGDYCVRDAEVIDVQVVGEHEKAVKTVCWQKELGCCVSGSWDRTMKVWDTRQNHCVATSQLPDKIFTMAVTSNLRSFTFHV